MSTATQQALIIPSPKAPFVIGPRPIPVPAKGQVRLKLLSVGLNPLNSVQHEFDVFISEYPAVIGADFAGVVDEVGEDVVGFSKGDEVFGQALNGGFQQYTTVPTAILIRKPKNITFDDAASFPATFPTACVGLFAQAPIGLALNPSFSWDRPQQGESALVIGGGTSTGQFAVQLLKFLGFTRIVVYASKVHFYYLKQLGATECIDRADVPLEKLVVKPPVKVVYDATFTGALDAAYDSVVDGGKVTTVRPEAKTERDPRSITLVHCFGFYVGPDVMEPIGDPAHWHASVEHTIFGKRIIEELPKMVEHGVIVPNRIEVLPNGLAGIPDALERMKAGGVRGVKVIAHPQESAP
ncbi:GroES-like protein [Mycena sanguinolenta]|uniref:GroES-like protein n=1 Tax=Mycena sanguinolenta TaxID=230812 RepID=A0A8H6XNV6_9AGAR|nr:GroES-like protein [Mycena sanguinolenta]